MPLTTIDQLTKKNGKDLENGNGSKNKYGALYYFEDIDIVIKQAGFKNLIELNVIFKLDDGNNRDPNGNPVYEITVIAAQDNAGNYLNKVALPWAPYYDPESDSGTENFPGHDTYLPGRILRK